MAAEPSMRSGLVVWMACLVTAVAVPLLITSLDSGGSDVAHASAPGASSQEVDELARRLELLEERLARATLTPHDASRPAPSEPLVALHADPMLADSAPLDLAGLSSRLTELEAAEQARIDERAAEEAEELAERERELARDLAARDAAHAIILDPNATEAQKAAAWRELRRLDGDAWSDEVVDEMVHLAETSQDRRVREAIWRGADARHTSERLLPAMRRAAELDGVADVREEAVEALSRYIDRPGVRELLERISRDDVSDDVRNQALRSLLQG